MKKKKAITFKKHPARMSSEELANGVFHPKVLKAAKAHLASMEASEKPRRRSK
jgi:hypothetical protein